MFPMATKQTMMIRASITAYSTAVGPSSDTKKFFTLFTKPFIAASKTNEAIASC
jgi:hypothetical protein